MLDSLIKLIIKVCLVVAYFYITAGLTLWMVLAFLILAWPVLLVVGYVCTRDLTRQFIIVNNCARK